MIYYVNDRQPTNQRFFLYVTRNTKKLSKGDVIEVTQAGLYYSRAYDRAMFILWIVTPKPVEVNPLSHEQSK